jgi:cobyrinic acid a,c-diamide synthase
MYLGERLTIGEKEYPMAGALPVSFAMIEKPQGHGYTIMDVVAENPYFPVGGTLKGHEFHHSRIVSADEKHLRFAFRMKRGTGIDGLRDGLCKNQILGSYTHIHALGTRDWAGSLLERAEACRITRYKNRAKLDATGRHRDGKHENMLINSTSWQQ